MSYKDEIKKHLIAYKKTAFTDFKHGFWMRSKPPKELEYAFRKKDETNNDEDENIISFYQKQFIESRFSVVKRHMCFHHMNSSQAMCFNFFYPLYKENCLETITEYLGFKDEKVIEKTVLFEKLSTIDSKKGHRPTNFDFYFETESGKKFFFEIKYTEYEFGKAADDKGHNNKFENVYNTNNIFNPIHASYREKQLFFKNYQIIRNLIHVASDSYVVFVYPKDNIRIKKQAVLAKSEIIKETFQKNLFTIEWEDMFKKVNDKVKVPTLKSQMAEFGKKYFIDTK
ncbi:PGN_0703 family putative restriction endonuclease [Lacinutrix mariniflava]|uniref:PGN_0703 family putative restriction endonuclease n=1 Tax=Lacinutrix mariniflava TaxID=342955 RepID=UPI0006E3E1D3|nr:hypothetical protein [Lacinutrix mariniflava]